MNDEIRQILKNQIEIMIWIGKGDPSTNFFSVNVRETRRLLNNAEVAESKPKGDYKITEVHKIKDNPEKFRELAFGEVGKNEPTQENHSGDQNRKSEDTMTPDISQKGCGKGLCSDCRASANNGG
jgi:hypothetical protein|tara:strand:- start:573 stop:947 length:375 start_codon:yes stop_codon:yes gene_type:complete